MPDGNKYHWIEDKHLEIIMNINSPLSSSISLTCLGIALGEARDIKTIIDETTITAGDLLTVAVFAGAVIAFLLAGIHALKTKTDAKTILNEIRSRKPIAWSNQNESQRSAGKG